VAFDGNVSVLVGGNLHVGGAAAGAEGTVVTLGDATFARDVPGPYEVGATALGSQVTPYAGSDMLVVGGNLGATAGTHVDVGQGLGGDVVVGGGVADGTAKPWTPGSPTPRRPTSTSPASWPPSPWLSPASRSPAPSRSPTARSR
jgi:choice-of-anchor A domain-containing protein